jgi:hypothetical protein
LLVALVGYSIWSTQTQRPEAPTTEEEVVQEVEEEEEVVEVEEEATEAAEDITPVEIQEATPAAQEDDEALIKEAVLERVGLDGEDVEFMITAKIAAHAKGNIREVGAVSGGYWLASKEMGNWIAVYDGQANPPCVDVDNYNFPSDMVPECMDENNNLVTR